MNLSFIHSFIHSSMYSFYLSFLLSCFLSFILIYIHSSILSFNSFIWNQHSCNLLLDTTNISNIKHTVDGFIFVGTNFRGLNKNDTFVGFKIRGHSIFFRNSYGKLPFRGYWNSWIRSSTKTMKIVTLRNLSHLQYIKYAYLCKKLNQNKKLRHIETSIISSHRLIHRNVPSDCPLIRQDLISTRWNTGMKNVVHNNNWY